MPPSRPLSRQTETALQLLGSEIRLARKRRRWSASDLAERAGISRTTLSKIEAGDPGCTIGIAFEVATLVGLPLFTADSERLATRNRHVHDALTLLPERIRKPAQADIKDDF